MKDADRSIVRAPDDAAFEAWTFGDGGACPNNPVLPVMVMAGALSQDATGAEIFALLDANGWAGGWRWTVFDYHHFHPNAHEVLVVASGRADLVLGGPGGRTIGVAPGDVLVLPAGTGHFRADATEDFEVCGAYPAGQERYETFRVGDPHPAGLRERIAATPRPVTDPVHGADGPLLGAWGAGP